MELRNEALRLAVWHEERAREAEREARRPLEAEANSFWARSPSNGAWAKLDEVREYHDATAKTLRALAAELVSA